MGNSPDIFNDFVMGHPNSVIDYFQGSGFWIRYYPNMRVVGKFNQVRIGERFITQLINRVRGVGYEFTQKDLFVGIDRMNHQVQ